MDKIVQFVSDQSYVAFKTTSLEDLGTAIESTSFEENSWGQIERFCLCFYWNA